MAKVTQINPQVWHHILDRNTRLVMKVLNSYHITYRIVGGAVRNLLLGKAPRDVDLVAQADPSELIYVFEQAGLNLDLGGIAHGTVKAVFGHGRKEQKVDVSSLGYRILNLGGKLHITHAHNWRQDAELRDLTINALSMDMQGHVYDYVGGYSDLQNQIVRFCPKARAAIRKEPVGIMRYFRALVLFDNPQILTQDFNLIKTLVPKLATVAHDKKTQMNLITILNSEHRLHVLQLMCMLGVGKHVPSVPCLHQEQFR